MLGWKRVVDEAEKSGGDLPLGPGTCFHPEARMKKGRWELQLERYTPCIALWSGVLQPYVKDLGEGNWGYAWLRAGKQGDARARLLPDLPTASVHQLLAFAAPVRCTGALFSAAFASDTVFIAFEHLRRGTP